MLDFPQQRIIFGGIFDNGNISYLNWLKQMEIKDCYFLYWKVRLTDVGLSLTLFINPKSNKIFRSTKLRWRNGANRWTRNNFGGSGNFSGAWKSSLWKEKWGKELNFYYFNIGSFVQVNLTSKPSIRTYFAKYVTSPNLLPLPKRL